MKLTLYTQRDIPSDGIARHLKANGVDTEIIPLENLGNEKQLIHGITALVAAEQGVVWLGEKVLQVRRVLKNNQQLILCIPSVSRSERVRLLEFGKTYLVSPRTWSPSDVAERLLGELIVRDFSNANFGRLFGSTPQMRRLYADIQTIAPIDDPVLILGETGTGKELISHELHARSGRPGEMIALNCAEFKSELLTAELFGTVQGAFTDARDRKGLLAEAGQKTVFLDEIGELDRAAQAQLLRVIEERKFRPVGANVWHPFQGRLVLATHRDLEADCVEGRFRDDLFRRIGGFILKPPPLRERRADLPLLAERFVAECRSSQGFRDQLELPPESVDALFHYNWPGNVRELRLAVRRGAVFADSNGCIGPMIFHDLSRGNRTKTIDHSVIFDPLKDSLKDVVSRAQTQYLKALLMATGNNKEEAMRRTGLSKTQFYEKLKELSK